jgi:predicted RNA binding protein YcfA (HicA-like mRNA interferase family)
MTKRVTFAELEKLLIELGFVPQSVQGAHRVFQNPALSTLVVLPGYKSQDWVHPAHLVSIKKVLTENDLMSAGTFDTLTSSAKVSV